MFSSPMSHYFRHVLLAYKESGMDIAKRIEVNRQLSTLEDSCISFIQRNGSNPRAEAMLEKVRRMKENLA